MAIYTKTGDEGITSLYNGDRVPKSDARIKACGEADELSSFVGLVSSKIRDETHKELLLTIQKDLHSIMGFLSEAKLDETKLEKQIKKFEQIIDKEELTLPKLNRFILPSGNESSSWFHVLRTICRRAERSVVKCKTMEQLSNRTIDNIITYLNRLSDLFFIFARMYNREKEVKV